MRSANVRRLAAAAFAVALTACGGSGGGGGGGLTNADLVGTYFAFQFSGTDDATTEAFTATGTFTADGMGGASRTYVANDMGVISGPFSKPFTYSVASGGALDLSLGLGATARGGVTASGDCALLALIGPGLNPGVMPLFRRAGVLSAASLSGAYHMTIFRASPANGDSETFTEPVTFNGAGGLTFQLETNNEGTIRRVHPVPPRTPSRPTARWTSISANRCRGGSPKTGASPSSAAPRAGPPVPRSACSS